MATKFQGKLRAHFSLLFSMPRVICVNVSCFYVMKYDALIEWNALQILNYSRTLLVRFSGDRVKKILQLG